MPITYFQAAQKKKKHTHIQQGEHDKGERENAKMLTFGRSG